MRYKVLDAYIRFKLSSKRSAFMKLKNKFIALATMLAMLGSSANHLAADDGDGYADSSGSTNLAPAIALGAIAIVAIVAVAVQESGHHHHGHN